MDQSGSLNRIWSGILVEELCRNGVTLFCVAPGSRSTPLTVAVAENDRTESVVHYDERGLAFFAIGYARATGRPAAIITTSGTAVANLLPAVVEASAEEIPLILLTADRPPELRQTSANQTIDQLGIFGSYLRWQTDIPCPDKSIPHEMIMTTAAQGVSATIEPSAGPVQLNCMFREPLLPKDKANIAEKADKVHREDGSPFTRRFVPLLLPSEGAVARVRKVVASSRRSILVIGSLRDDTDREAAFELSRKLRWPTFADITSSLRLRTSESFVSYYDLILGSERFGAANRPDTVLHLGGRITSKRLQRFIEHAKPDDYIQVNTCSQRMDPGHIVSDHIRCSVTSLVEGLGADTRSSISPGYYDSWKAANDRASQIVSSELDEEPDLTEPVAARLLSRMLPNDCALFVASSMPVRAMDMYADNNPGVRAVAANRGASGIDGTIASAAGFASAKRMPLTCFTGDLAMLHDINSLPLLRQSNLPVIVVIANNYGGGIFNLLPVSNIGEVFRSHFITPHQFSFEHAASMFSLPYRRASTPDEFRSAYTELINGKDSAIVELSLTMADDYRRHRYLLSKVVAAADELS